MARDTVRTSIEIDRMIWAKFKAECTMERKTVAELVQELITKYLDEKG